MRVNAYKCSNGFYVYRVLVVNVVFIDRTVKSPSGHGVCIELLRLFPIGVTLPFESVRTSNCHAQGSFAASIVTSAISLFPYFKIRFFS